jgi:uncharacterized protein (DUF302 family)
VHSPLSFAKTAANLLIALERRGMTLHARIDHAANAAAAGFELRPTLVFIFNYPEVEAALLVQCPLMGLDLPRKIAVREDVDGKVWIDYNDPAWLGRRYDADPKLRSLLHAMSNSFAGIVLEAGAKAPPARAK